MLLFTFWLLLNYELWIFIEVLVNCELWIVLVLWGHNFNNYFNSSWKVKRKVFKLCCKQVLFYLLLYRQIFTLNKPGGRGGVVRLATGCPIRGLSSYRVSAKGLVQLQGVSSGDCPATGCPLRGLSSYKVSAQVLVQLQGVSSGACPATGCPLRGLSSYRVSHGGASPATGWVSYWRLD